MNILTIKKNKQTVKQLASNVDQIKQSQTA